MSKAILVLDEMPENCGWCKLCDRLSTCMPTKYTIPSQDLDEGRPDWCPLIESDEIEKLTPKKVVMGNYTHRCPNCNSCVEGCEKFCRECGQALDWEI